MAHICTVSLACHAEVNFTLVSMSDDVTRSRSIVVYGYVTLVTMGIRIVRKIAVQRTRVPYPIHRFQSRYKGLLT